MKARRYKVECSSCGSIFNNDYKRNHEIKVHGGNHVKVKCVGAPENPFVFASKSKRPKLDHQDDELQLLFSTEPSTSRYPVIVGILDIYVDIFEIISYLLNLGRKTNTRFTKINPNRENSVITA